MSSLFSMTAVLLGAFGMAGCQRLAVVAPETPCCEREQGGGQDQASMQGHVDLRKVKGHG